MTNIIQVSFCLLFGVAVKASPLVLKESSPSGESIVAIASSDPQFNDYINFALTTGQTDTTQKATIEQDTPEDVIKRSFSFVSPGNAAAGNGRSFVSTSAFNPYLLPLFFNPINFEGFGLNNYDSLNNWFKGVEGVYEPGYAGNGEVKTVSAVNDNGHIYGNVKTITFDNRPQK